MMQKQLDIVGKKMKSVYGANNPALRMLSRRGIGSFLIAFIGVGGAIANGMTMLGKKGKKDPTYLFLTAAVGAYGVNKFQKSLNARGSESGFFDKWIAPKKDKAEIGGVKLTASKAKAFDVITEYCSNYRIVDKFLSDKESNGFGLIDGYLALQGRDYRQAKSWIQKRKERAKRLGKSFSLYDDFQEYVNKHGKDRAKFLFAKMKNHPGKAAVEKMIIEVGAAAQTVGINNTDRFNNAYELKGKNNRKYTYHELLRYKQGLI